MKRLSLAGTWEFRLDEAAPWHPVAVPGCWETLGIRKDFPGPTWYRKQVRVPKAFAGKRVWLRFEGVSYYCTVTVNGWEAGSHRGIWDGFRLEITSAIVPGETAEVVVEVEKPASLKQGPASEAVPGSFPLRETLSGFLPYVRAHIIASHYGEARGAADVTWRVSLPAQPPFAEGAARAGVQLEPGTVREAHIAEFTVPDVKQPVQATLTASVTAGKESSINGWALWFFPRDAWQEVQPFNLVDPMGRLEGLHDLAPVAGDTATRERVLVTTAWTAEVETCVTGGGRVIFLQPGREPEGPLPTDALPFWREAVKIIEPHPAWGDFPHEGWVNLQFYGLATDFALDTEQREHAQPILRRLDARTMRLHEYATALHLGEGRAIVSTLRFEGGLGDQPLGITRNPAAAHLLSCWIRYLQLEKPGFLV
jgi:hypothetical protein